MPGRFLSEAERDRLGRFPKTLPEGDLITFFTLSEEDHALLGSLRGDYNRLGCALQLAALRLLGFVPDDLAAAPHQAIRFVADQLHAALVDLETYGARVRARQQHLQQVLHHLRFRRPTPMDLDLIGAWLLERALEHDRPTLLFEQACEKLRRDRILRPGMTVLERLVVRARTEAHAESLRRLGSLLTDQVRALPDPGLLPPSNARRRHRRDRRSFRRLPGKGAREGETEYGGVPEGRLASHGSEGLALSRDRPARARFECPRRTAP